MTITKLKSIGSWQTVRWLEGGGPRVAVRGRVITGLLTSDTPAEPIVEGEARKGR